jgi:hypothetical protein
VIERAPRPVSPPLLPLPPQHRFVRHPVADVWRCLDCRFELTHLASIAGPGSWKPGVTDQVRACLGSKEG